MLCACALQAGDDVNYWRALHQEEMFRTKVQTKPTFAGILSNLPILKTIL
jgi:hypothetical protein